MSAMASWLGQVGSVLTRQIALPDEEGLLPRPEVVRKAAVLMLLSEGGAGLQMLLTRRTEHLRSHAGQISFPGGKLDGPHEGVVAAALREAREEVGLDAAAVEVLGVLPSYITITGYEVAPVLALQTRDWQLSPQPDEVAEVFCVPWRVLADLSAYERHPVRREGFSGHYYSISYRDYYIWGATAAMLRRLAAILPPLPE